MAITIGRYTFEGPFESTFSIEDRSGIYAVLSHNGLRYDVVDIGESATVRSRIESHDRADCWARYGGRYYAVYYTPFSQQPARKQIEQELRRQYNPPCGDR